MDETDLALDDLPAPEFEGTLPPDELSVDGDNPNEMTDSQFGLLCDRMADNGWLGGPIITDTDGLISDGEHRWRAAQEIGLAEVPVRQYDISDSKRRLWRQELNKIHGEHDTKRDALEYDTLLSEGFTEEVEALTEAAGEDLDELLAEIRMDGSRPAQYDYDPEHNVYFEDCVEGMRERLEDDSVDCVITDPPYGIDFESGFKDTNDGIHQFGGIQGDSDTDFLEPTAREINRVLRDNSHCYVFTRWDQYPEVIRHFEPFFEPNTIIVWDKKLHTSGDLNSWAPRHEFIVHFEKGRPAWHGKRLANVIRVGGVGTNKMDPDHPTQKPAGVIEPLLDVSTQPGDTVLDPFMGSGTTAVAAIQNDRDYVGFEIDAENYRDVIERRIGEAKRQREASVNQDEAEAD